MTQIDRAEIVRGWGVGASPTTTGITLQDPHYPSSVIKLAFPPLAVVSIVSVRSWAKRVR